MHLSRSSRTVRWAYLFTDRIPARNSLCALFWRVVFVTPVLKILTPLGAIVFLVSRFWWYPKRSFVVAGALAVFVVILSIVEHLKERAVQRRANREARANEPHVIRDGFKAIKAKVCPLVEITD